MNSAYRLVKYALEGPRAGGMAPALLCTTGPAAMGAIRAFYDAGFEVGKDVSICAINDESLGPYLMPSLTSLQVAPRGPYLQSAANWLLGGEGVEWQGPLLVQPDSVPMFIGGSTGSPSGRSLESLATSKASDM
jgi:hypothetical protein